MRILACEAAPFCKALVCCCCFNLPRQQPQLIVEVPATPNQPARSQNVVGQLGDVLEKKTSAPRFLLAISAFSGHRSRVSFSFGQNPEIPSGGASKWEEPNVCTVEAGRQCRRRRQRERVLNEDALWQAVLRVFLPAHIGGQKLRSAACQRSSSSCTL